MPFLIIAIDITRGLLRAAETHDAELSAILQQAHSAMVMRALPQALYDTNATTVGEVRYQERAPFHFVEPPADDPARPAAADRAGPKGHGSQSRTRTKTADSRGYPPAVAYPAAPRKRRG